MGIKMKILIVEDDTTIASGISYSLEQEQYEVTAVTNVADAMKYIHDQSYELFLLDLSLPDGSGYDICRKVKALRDVPVIFLTACDEEVNIVMGLDMGADDYITKPFRVRELLSRINSVLRRYQKSGTPPAVLHFDTIRIHTAEAKVYKGDSEVILTALEYRLLLTLASHAGQVLSRNQLLEGIWDISGDFVNDNTLTVYIKRLREKLEDGTDSSSIIQTIRGLGYRLGVDNGKK